MKRLCLVHVPKTAGTYIRSILKNETKYFDHRSHSFFGMTPHVMPRASKYAGAIGVNYTRQLNIKRFIFFTVVRNPYDLLYSYYSHTRNGYSGWGACNTVHSIKDFEDFIDKYCNLKFKWHVPILQEMLFSQLFNRNGVCMVHHIIRYERLEEGLKELCHRYGMEGNFDLPKKNITPNKKSYKEVYNSKMKEQVAKKCSLELKMFGYDFDGPTDDSVFVTKRLTYKRKRRS
jgi:hypothetical protein